MTDVTTETEGVNLPEATLRMMSIAQRSMAVAAKMQALSVAKANGSEYSLMDASTLAKAYTNVWTRMLTKPQELWAAQLQMGTSMAQAWANSGSRVTARSAQNSACVKLSAW